MNNLYRSLISLATVFPLSITFSYLYSDWLLSLLPDVVSHFFLKVVQNRHDTQVKMTF